MSDDRVALLEQEVRTLKERIAFLERGADVVARAHEYATRFAAYDSQVHRLATALEEARIERRELSGVT